MKVKSFLYALVMVTFICLPILSNAQLDPGGDFDPGGDPDVPIPFDGGLSLLLAAGIGYGAKKAYAKRKKAADTVNFNSAGKV